MIDKIKNWIKSNKAFMISFIAGLILFIVAALLSDYEVAPIFVMCYYLSFFLILVSIFIFFSKRKKIVLVNIALIFLLTLVLEIVCFFLQGMPPVYNKELGPPDLPEDHISMNIGTVPYADKVKNDVLVKDNDTVFNVNYTIDKNCLRVTPNNDNSKKDFVLFFGCSIAFGHGLEDNETLPYQFQEVSEKYNSYNYAYNGYGTNHMLARMEYQDLSEDVKEENGIAVYVFFWDHIYRSIGTMDRYCDWLSNAPYYTFEGDELVRKKMFNNGRYFVSKAYEYLHQLNIIKQFDVAFPSKLNESHYDLVSEMILKSKETYTQQFGNDKFYVAIYPSYMDYSQEEMDKFKSYLTKKNINIIDMSKHIKYGPEYTLGGDPHPNSNTNKIISSELWKRIQSN